MPRVRRIVAAFLLAPLLVGCGPDTHEKVMGDTVATMQKVVTILKTVKDEKSATAAKPRLETIGKDMDRIKARAEKLGQLDMAKGKALMATYESQMKNVASDFMAEMMRIGMNPALGLHLADVLGKLGPPK